MRREEWKFVKEREREDLLTARERRSLSPPLTFKLSYDERTLFRLNLEVEIDPILSSLLAPLCLPFLLPPSRLDLLVLREGASESPRAAALLLPAPHLVGAGAGPRLAALRPQRALAGALPARAAG